ncbi:DUF1153 domain-containing protein [Sphingomonas sp. AP4-R1]|uniref:DUF1153 domain-containing protein n=1 Tax=Sphingomonas sp. AP4-R1 TaxID=2735134 RepID=UPI001493CEB7|nr:DUF1153 domain-containing protein [Sphingomonas sp. AP4-R1]QJU56948.1 DUF1153 domain-containing protein [Sphingomonas sp. AP4-R1]
MPDSKPDRLQFGRRADAGSGWTIGPFGQKLTLADLPPPNPPRWIRRLKAEVVAAVNGGLLTTDEACERYNLTAEELACWVSDAAAGGLNALNVKSIPKNRARRR